MHVLRIQGKVFDPTISYAVPVIVDYCWLTCCTEATPHVMASAEPSEVWQCGAFTAFPTTARPPAPWNAPRSNQVPLL